MMHCDAIVTYRATDYSFEPVYCSQVVGIRSYQSGEEPITVAYCAISGHESNVRRRFAEIESDIHFHMGYGHDEPECADGITMAKAAADRMAKAAAEINPLPSFGQQTVRKG